MVVRQRVYGPVQTLVINLNLFNLESKRLHMTEPGEQQGSLDERVLSNSSALRHVLQRLTFRQPRVKSDQGMGIAAPVRKCSLYKT